MVDVKRLAEMDADELAKVQSVISLFALLGVDEKGLALLPEMIANWPIVVKNMNAMAADLANLKQSVSSGENGGSDASLDTADAIRDMIGFGVNRESVVFGGKGGKGE